MNNITEAEVREASGDELNKARRIVVQTMTSVALIARGMSDRSGLRERYRGVVTYRSTGIMC